LQAPAGQLTFHLSLFVPENGEPVTAHIIVWDRWLGRALSERVYVDAIVFLQRGCWQQIDLPLRGQPLPDEEVEVRIAINGDARASPPVEEPRADERCVAVHRFWMSDRAQGDR
jgi:hypothetical protein